MGAAFLIRFEIHDRIGVAEAQAAWQRMSNFSTVDLNAGFKLGEWRVDPRLGELYSQTSGIAVTLRPKSMQVLLELVAAGGDVVDRGTLREKVWPETLASDESLSRCVADIRAALASGDAAVTYIETLPKRGYRIGVQAEAPGAEVLEASGVPERRHRWPFLVILVLVIAALVWWGRTHVAPPPRPAPIIAIHLEEQSAESAGDRLILLAVADLLYQRLSEVSGVVVRSPRLTDDNDSGIEDLAGAAVWLSLVPTPGVDKRQLLVQLQIRGQNRGREAGAVLGRFDVPMLENNDGIATFVDVRDELVMRIRERVGPALALPNSSRVLQPRDAEAFRLYLEARDLLSRPGCDGTAPNVLLEQSLKLDPEYVPARVALGWANYGLAATCGLGSQYYEAALAQADEAISQAGGWVPATALKATVMVETGQASQALEALETALVGAPDSPYLHFAASYALVYAGRLGDAEEQLDRTLAIDPLFLVAEGWTPNALLYQGKNRRFLALLPATKSTLFDFYRGFVLHRLGLPEEARANLIAGFRRQPGDVFGMLSGAMIAAMDGDQEHAIQLLQVLDRRRTETGNRDGEITFRTAQIAAIARDVDFASRLVARAWSEGFTCTACIDSDPFLGTILDVDSFSDRIAPRQVNPDAYGATGFRWEDDRVYALLRENEQLLPDEVGIVYAQIRRNRNGHEGMTLSMLMSYPRSFPK
jgi:DNA-binding winged helix-turn-helix (wHTH) protein/tetratricopeptide (TPR) repeat protein